MIKECQEGRSLIWSNQTCSPARPKPTHTVHFGSSWKGSGTYIGRPTNYRS